jgi:hypothetical protein
MSSVSFDRLQKGFDGRGIVAGVTGQKDPRHFEPRGHFLLPKDTSQEEPADGRTHDPRQLPGKALHRTPHEYGQVIADLAQRPIANSLVALRLQLSDIGRKLVEIVELKGATRRKHRDDRVS